MAHFVFKAKKSGGEIYKSERDASDRYELYRMIRQDGEEVVSVEEKKGFSFSKNAQISLPFLNSIKTLDKINFVRNLGSMIVAGLSVSRALSVMERQGKSPKVKKIISSINDDVKKGKTLSDAMKGYKNMFSPLVISMVHAGEEGGTLAESLRVVGLQMEKNYSLQRRIRGAMMYPGIILFAMIIIGIIMLTYIVPSLMKTFGELNLSLPTSTKIILAISNAVTQHGIVLLGAIAGISALIYMWSRQASGKRIIHMAFLKIPLIGNLVKEVNTARTARALSSLINSGVDMMQSLRITADILQNVHYKKILEEAVLVVEKGEPLSTIFIKNEKLYPIFLGEMMSVGEETGKIGEMLLGVAVYYEDDVDQKTKDMSTIIEPFLMVIIGAAVGFFAVAMISPMYSLVNVI